MAANDEGGKTTDWEGGSLDDLLGLLAEGSWSARIEATSASGPYGVMDVVAGGVSESQAGDLRGDAAVAAMRARQDLTYRIRLRLPNPDTGGIDPPGPAEGSLAQRSVASLMRYCEDFVLSCALVLNRDGEIARIVYKRGEIAASLVDGVDAPQRLADVMGWRTGDFRIDVEGPTLRRRTGKRPAVTAGQPTTLFGYAGPTQAAVIAAAASMADGAKAGGQPAGKGRPGDHATPKVGLQAVGRAPTPARGSTSGDRATATRPTPRHPSPATAGGGAAHPTPKSGTPITPVESPVPLVAAGKPAAPAGPTALVNRTSPPAPRPRRDDWISATPAPEIAPSGFLAAPVIVHVLLGVALGGLIVVAYWVYLRNGGAPLDLG